MFMPRALKVKRPTDNTSQVLKKKCKVSQEGEKEGRDSSTEESEEEEPVKSFRKSQRWPEPGEPVCVMCSRFGEYICDSTDNDVCSLECKASHLAKMGMGTGEDAFNPVDRAGNSVEGVYKDYSYKEDAFISGLTEEQVQRVKQELGIVTEGREVGRPIIEFEQCNLPSTLSANLKKAGYEAPTPVQMQMVPVGLAGRDVIASADTGSGKTVAFLLPVVVFILKSFKGPCPFCLTRTVHINQDFSIHINVNVPELAKGNTILTFADTMLKMGFQQQILKVLENIPEERQTLLTSATIPKGTEQLAARLTQDPVRIAIGDRNQPCADIRQIVLWVEEPSKKKKLFEILNDGKLYQPPVVVFVDCKLGADLLCEAVKKIMGLNTVAIHSDKTQWERNRILKVRPVAAGFLFISTKRKMTDWNKEGSVGRAGRLGHRGTAITFVNNDNKRLFLEVVNRVKPTGSQLPPQLLNSPHLHEQQRKGKQKAKQRGEDDIMVTKTNLLDIIRKHKRSSKR
uniref:RNA helicase n=1 Tax=Hucho hucho TaxID=62062 RepID=A0A4W5MBG3_9TELE